ncbi:MAG: DNA methyltransferase [Theionarchaea archaeon]|nr:DNA methyltransferase [Theionarchaea archaeon]
MEKTENRIFESHHDPSDLFSHLGKFPINKGIIPQKKLDLTKKTRSSLFPWRGQFSPELIEVLLNKYSDSHDVILDPFAGSGTTLFESARKNLPCYGAELNPAAVEMSRMVQFANLSTSARNYHIKKAKDLINSHLPLTTEGLFRYIDNQKTGNTPDVEMFKEILGECSYESPEYTIIINTILRYFASNKRLNETSRIRNSFKRNANIIRSLPYDENTCEIFHADARKIPLDDETVNLVITSPPYINVFNYHQNHRQIMELAGWDLLKIAKSEIGSNRKNRQNRFLTVIQYSIDMLLSLLEMRRLLHDEGRIIMIIGRESNVRRVRFENYRILAMLALAGAGLDLICRQERKFTNRFGKTIYEDLLHFEIKGEPVKCPENISREISVILLNNALTRAKDKVKSDIEVAIEHVPHVRPSPMLQYDAQSSPRADRYEAITA